MSPINPRQRLWIIIIALLAVVIIVGSYLLLTNSKNEMVVVLSPDEIMSDSEKYVGKTITVDGYYYHEVAEGRGVITSSIIQPGASLTNYKRLPVDYSNVNISLAENVKYHFTGVLEKESSVGNPVVLVAEKIVQV